MNDRELLELAAKAAGIQFEEWIEVGVHSGFTVDYGVRPNGTCWNPLTDDGDALRLEVAVNMTTKHRFLEILAEENTNCSGDYIKARRRAITRYAAKIGKEIS